MILRLLDHRDRADDELAAEESLLAALVSRLGRPQWALNVVLVDDEAMQDLNVRYHGGSGVTDVLSFSYLEAASDQAGSDTLAGGTAGAATTLWLPDARDDEAAGEVPLAGEIVLAPRFIADRCRRESWDLRLEWAMLVVHGALHILGWDHAEAAPQREMRALEAAALAAEGLAHPLLPETEMP
jgi:probable rRNA maturation factor